MNDSKDQDTADEITPGMAAKDSAATPNLAPDILADRKKAVLEQKQYVTGRVSETCRFIGFGLVAIYYTLTVSGEQYAKELFESYTWYIRAFGAFGALTVFLDYIQYIAGDRAAARALTRTNDGNNSYRYSKKWLSYKVRGWSYFAKQLFCFLGSASLVYVMVTSLF
ncbi:hypothetical protein WG622_18010 [Cognatishimia sp. D5M38]|uniref:Uncharacterized protein n=1 Tax=Cognatishimia coralii TaxID=3083254 RepID=A0ABU8QL64_9RHOB